MSSGHVDYGYGPKNGPHTWCLTCPAAAGPSQSPINIIRHRCVEDTMLEPIHVTIGEKGSQNFSRKKHNFQVSFPGRLAATLEGGPLNKSSGCYNLEQFHCHWGCEDEWGSEHQVDGHNFSGELHLVFVNKRFTSLTDALHDPEGICVIGIFLKSGNTESEGMKPLIAAIMSSQPNCEMPIEQKIDLHNLIPSIDRYFSYTGSLTTPPCAECVRWIVCADPLEISKQQLNAMRSMHSCEDCETNENFRPPMPLGNRKVLCSFKQNLE